MCHLLFKIQTNESLVCIFKLEYIRSIFKVENRTTHPFLEDTTIRALLIDSGAPIFCQGQECPLPFPFISLTLVHLWLVVFLLLWFAVRVSPPPPCILPPRFFSTICWNIISSPSPFFLCKNWVRLNLRA